LVDFFKKKVVFKKEETKTKKNKKIK